VSYTVTITRVAQKELGNLAEPNFTRICEALEGLAEDPRPLGIKKLKGREGWRLRIGDYRVIYEIDDTQKIIIVLHVGHRRDIYR
jgi:mRNA interferase RelE/StbE